jgi:hypothetical protein
VTSAGLLPAAFPRAYNDGLSGRKVQINEPDER